MKLPEHVARQREFYDTREHDHLQAREDDLYADKLATELARRLGITATHRVLEVGAGFGRFTFPLLQSAGSLVAVDLSPRALSRLEETRAARRIPTERCLTRCADLDTLDAEPLGGRFDFVVGFFLLHHLHDFPASIARLARLLAPGGRLGFLEPNRRNPAFWLQVALCPDMTWREERGMFRLSRAKVERAYREAGLVPLPAAEFGFFPPQLFNRSGLARSLEARLEQSRLLRPWLPFLVLGAELP